MYLTIITDASPAQGYLLKMVRCQCTSGCDSLRCSSRWNGLPCSFACGDCKGALWANAAAMQDEDDNEDEQEEELALDCALQSRSSNAIKSNKCNNQNVENNQRVLCVPFYK